jgi:hypothetical protein
MLAYLNERERDQYSGRDMTPKWCPAFSRRGGADTFNKSGGVRMDALTWSGDP